MRREILLKFYKAVIESVLTFSICVWFGGLTSKEESVLNRIIKISGRIIGTELPSLEELYKKRSLTKASKIVRDVKHPANEMFSFLPSGKRYKALEARTNGFKNSFYPQAISLLNSK